MGEARGSLALNKAGGVLLEVSPYQVLRGSGIFPGRGVPGGAFPRQPYQWGRLRLLIAPYDLFSPTTSVDVHLMPLNEEDLSMPSPFNQEASKSTKRKTSFVGWCCWATMSEWRRLVLH